MARMSRVEVFSASEVAIVHVMNRVVRRCFLLGDDPVSGKNYDHRKQWIEELLRRFAASFGIDLLGFAILSNHFHLILRSRPDVVETWDDTEVARRWLMLCPVRKTVDRLPEEPNEMELNSIRNDAQKQERHWGHSTYLTCHVLISTLTTSIYGVWSQNHGAHVASGSLFGR